MKSFVCSALLMLGTFFMAQSQPTILMYQVENGSPTYFWEVEIYPGYPAVSEGVNPSSIIKGAVDLKSFPITWVATKTNGCVANGIIPTSAQFNWTPVTVTCPPGQTAQAYHYSSGTSQWPQNTSLFAYDLKIRLN